MEVSLLLASCANLALAAEDTLPALNQPFVYNHHTVLINGF